MKKNYGSKFHYLLKYYNKCVRKYQRLKDSNVNANRLHFLAKRIEQTLSKILVFVPRLKKQISLAALAGSFLLISQNSNGQVTFGPQQVNPFGLTQEIRNIGYEGQLSQTVFVDIDDDGDLDIIDNKYGLGANPGETRFYENTGTASTPVFAAPILNPFSIQAGKYEGIDFADLDNDGDLDLMSYDLDGRDFKFYENTGTASNPNFAAPVVNPFGLSTNIRLMTPSLVDLDNDGDFDLIVFGYGSDVTYYENTGTASNPSFAAEVVNPFGIAVPSSNYYNKQGIADLDNDGDFDIMVGRSFGNLTYFENIGTSSTPNFTAPVTNPFGISMTNEESTTCYFGDIDNDGDMDILSQNQTQLNGTQFKRDFIIFENTSPSTAGLVENNLEIKVYPNPVEDIININVTENTSMSLLNLLGEEIKTIDIIAGNNTIDVCNLPSGVYLLQDVSGTFSSKVVKD